MDADFAAVVQAHRAKYPLMQPQDYAKLAYQSEFGPEYMAPSVEDAAALLEREWAEVPAEQPPAAPVDIGGGLCRFSLGRETDIPAASALLAKLFCRTARSHRGTREGLEQKLALLAEMDVPGMAVWLAQYCAAGCPAVHHSVVYRAAYHPRYRLLEWEYARFWPALRAVWSLARRGTPALVAIDGRCGSGKTTLAALIAALTPCNVLHMDDYYLPAARRAADWEQTPGGNIDLARFRQEVLQPLQNGQSIVCRAFDCGTQQLRQPATLPRLPLTVVEGSYCLHPLLRESYDLTVFVDCSPEEQLRRLRQREGAYVQRFLQRWIPMEERYHAACAVRRHAMITVDSTAP